MSKKNWYIMHSLYGIYYIKSDTTFHNIVQSLSPLLSAEITGISTEITEIYAKKYQCMSEKEFKELILNERNKKTP